MEFYVARHKGLVGPALVTEIGSLRWDIGIVQNHSQWFVTLAKVGRIGGAFQTSIGFLGWKFSDLMQSNQWRSYRRNRMIRICRIFIHFTINLPYQGWIPASWSGYVNLWALYISKACWIETRWDLQKPLWIWVDFSNPKKPCEKAKN